MKSSLAAAIIAVLISISGAHAKGITVANVPNCGDWISARSNQAATNFEAFLIGWLNGASLASEIEFWFANGQEISPEQAYFWMDKYCRENPLTYVTIGAYKLIDERSGGAFRTKMNSR